MRALVVVQLGEHADQRGKALLVQRIRSAPQVQFCYELAGSWDLALLFDCATMAEFDEVAERVLVDDAPSTATKRASSAAAQVRAVRSWLHPWSASTTSPQLPEEVADHVDHFAGPGVDQQSVIVIADPAEPGGSVGQTEHATDR